MKRTLTVLLALCILSFAACGVSVSPSEHSEYVIESSPEFRYEYRTFEEALLEFATDVVVAQYVGHRPFSDNLTEFEFIVSKRILGDAADRIFVYVRHTDATVFGSERSVLYNPGDFTFVPGVEYLLPLTAINSPYAMTHEDGFVFILNIVIDLEQPQNSIMYSESLYHHAEGLDFNSRNISREQIESYVGELTRDITPPRGVIRSESIEDIVLGSPHIFIVEINHPLRLSGAQLVTDVMLTDIYYVTIVEVLKGEIVLSDDLADPDGGFLITFFADTVLPGERHIVAVRPIEEGSPWFDFTSRNSLFRMDQLDEIMLILSGQ